MISLHECSDLSSILDLKADYLRSLIAPMDNMWEIGFTNMSPHWEIRSSGERAGYYAANDQGELLQFYVTPAFGREARALFDHVIFQDSRLRRWSARSTRPTSRCASTYKTK